MKCLFFALAVFSLLATPAFGYASKTVDAPPPETKSMVTSVNLKTHEITLRLKAGSYAFAKNLHTYTLDAITTITINHITAKFEEIRAGMQVLGMTERDDHTLDNITLESAGAAYK